MRTNKRASGIIIRDNKVLLIRRFYTGRGEYYIFPGGGMESTETLEDALVRELKEELGIKVETYRSLFDFNYQSKTFPGKKHDHYFLITKYRGEPRWMDDSPEKLKESENNQYHLEWHEIEKLPELPLIPEPLQQKIDEIQRYSDQLA